MWMPSVGVHGFPMPETVAVILAGGAGRRMGGNKPERRLFGQRLIDRSVQKARTWGLPTALSVKEPDQVSVPGCETIVDADFDGPIAGLIAGLTWADKRRATHVLFMPCDMPFVPDALLERFEAAREYACQPVVAASGDHWHPVCALWTVARLPDVLDFARSGGTRLTTVLTDCGAVDVSWDTHPFDPFFNINSLEDLNAAEDIARSEGLVQEVDGG